MLSNKHPLIITFTYDDYFYNAGPGFIWKTRSSTLYSKHAVAICGYDDSKNAVKVMNSWGTGWGDSGYTWIDYNLLPTLNTNAYVLNL
jgi:C1A family cysteine protease